MSYLCAEFWHVYAAKASLSDGKRCEISVRVEQLSSAVKSFAAHASSSSLQSCLSKASRTLKFAWPVFCAMRMECQREHLQMEIELCVHRTKKHLQDQTIRSVALQLTLPLGRRTSVVIPFTAPDNIPILICTVVRDHRWTIATITTTMATGNRTSLDIPCQ